jgi:hypothetical protein
MGHSCLCVYSYILLSIDTTLYMPVLFSTTIFYEYFSAYLGTPYLYL